MDMTLPEVTLPRGAYAVKYEWSIGIDIGQASDPTAICAIETPHFQMLHADLDPPAPSHRIRALRRLPLGLSYVAQCEQLAALLATPQLAGARVFLDFTGVGRPISDLIRSAGIKHIPITITGGREVHEHGEDGLSVPKLHLVSSLQAALHSGALKIAAGLPEAKAFVRELQEFRVHFTESGYAQFGARQGAHDDLVLAAALALYGATRPKYVTRIDGIGFAM
jgi:hypothetical protein